MRRCCRSAAAKGCKWRANRQSGVPKGRRRRRFGSANAWEKQEFSTGFDKTFQGAFHRARDCAMGFSFTRSTSSNSTLPRVDAANLPKPTGPPGARPDMDLLKSKIVNLNSLPMLPEVAIKAMAVARDPDASLRTLAGVIERDAALATSILRLVNSPFYRTGKTIESLEQAVIRLGLRECQNLIITVSIRSMHRNLPASKKQRCEVLWQHSFITASLCRQLNQRLTLGFRGEEFACGICHDIGRLLIAVGAPGYFDLVDPLDFRETAALLNREDDILGTNHTLLGAWFSQLNELPGTLAAAIEHHHHPAAAGTARPLVGLVAAADHMANHLQRREQIDAYDPAANPGFTCLSESWGEERSGQYLEQAQAIMTDVSREAEGVVGFQ
jgi:HD-like signal output (HDOD) protein